MTLFGPFCQEELKRTLNVKAMTSGELNKWESMNAVLVQSVLAAV